MQWQLRDSVDAGKSETFWLCCHFRALSAFVGRPPSDPRSSFDSRSAARNGFGDLSRRHPGLHPNTTNRSHRRSFLNRSPAGGSETTQAAAPRYAVEALKPSPSGMLRLTKRVGLSSFRDCF